MTERAGPLQAWMLVRADGEPVEPAYPTAADAKGALEAETAAGYIGLRVAHLVELRPFEPKREGER